MLRGTSKILVVEDEPSLRNGIATLLQLGGYEVIGASDGNEALAVLRVAPAAIGLILLDLQMPVVSGLEFRRRQLADPVLASIPVIAYSGDFVTLSEIRELGVKRCLKKPVGPEELYESVHACVAEDLPLVRFAPVRRRPARGSGLAARPATSRSA